jgi:serine/threonine-protein kinase
MARRPADRFKSVDELLDLINPQGPSFPRSSSPTPPTEDGEIVTDASTGSIRFPAAQRRRLFLVLAGILLAAAVAAAPFVLPRLRTYLSWSGPGTQVSRTLVVLPFENLGGDPASQRLCEGMQETVTSMLSRMEDARSSLVVVSSSEVRRSQTKTNADARKQFNADQVLTGSLQTNGGRLQLTINMADAQTRRQTDSRIFSVDPTELAELQRQLAGEIRGLVGSAPAPGALDSRAGETTRDSQAYRLFLQGQGALQNRNFDEAADLLKKAVESDPEYSLARAKLAEAYLRKNLSTREPKWLALADAEVAVALKNGPIPQALLAQAMIRKATGDHAKAIELFQQAIARDPGNIDAYNLLAQTFDDAGRSSEAESTYLNAIRLRPGYWPTYNSLATYFYGKHEYARAEQAYLTGLSLAPESPTLNYNLGALYFKMERWGDAAKSFEHSLSLQSTPLGHANLGTVLFYQGKYEESARHFHAAVDLQPGNPLNWGNLGEAQWQLPGLREGAKQAFEKAAVLVSEQLGLTPGNVKLRKSYAVYLAKLGRADEAKKQITMSLQGAPGDMDVHFGAARVYCLLAEQAHALDELASCLRLGYSFSEIRREPDLNPIRGTRQYQQLETEFRKRGSQ